MAGGDSFLIIGIGIWSLIIALDGYQQWLDIVHHTPAHGFSTYARYIDENYRADIFRCQIQFTVTTVLLLGMLLMLCWKILSHFLHRAGEVRSDILIRRKEIWKASKHDTTERSVS